MTENANIINTFIKGLEYIKNHNNNDDNTDSLDFDSSHLNMPDNNKIDFDKLIEKLEDNGALDDLGLTWQNNDNGGLYILPQGSYAESGDALTVLELLREFKTLVK